MRPNHLLAALLLCCFLACQKEPEELLTTPNCRIETIYHFDNNVPSDTATIEYNGDRIAKVDYGSFYAIPEYANGLISKRNYYRESTGALVQFDQNFYNADSSFSKVETWHYLNGSPTPLKGWEYNFTYSSGKLIQLLVKQDTSGTGVVPMFTYDYAYTGDNITSMVFTDLDWQISDTIYYSYDNLPNFYQKNNTIWQADLVFVYLSAVGLPFALSANNVVSYGPDLPNDAVSVTYDLTDKLELKDVRFDGEIFSRYVYKCQ
jgi:hypothetical protein